MRFTCAGVTEKLGKIRRKGADAELQALDEFFRSFADLRQTTADIADWVRRRHAAAQHSTFWLTRAINDCLI
jgi:hypothetical protein